MGLPWSTRQILTAADLNAAVIGRVDKNGDEMLGPLKLPGDPSDLLDAAPKQYIDGKTPPLAAPRPTGIIIPFYIYPNTPYTDATCLRLLDLIRQYHGVQVIIVVNAGTPGGPGAYDLNWEVIIRMFKAAGAIVCGYVDTNNALRDPALVQADIDGWLSIYSNAVVDGIFFDQVPFDPGIGNVNIDLYISYKEYCYARNLRPVIGNPGTNEGSVWFAHKAADIMIVWENSILPTEADMLQNFVDGHVFYPYTERGLLVYGQSSLDLYFVRRMRRYVQFIYVNDTTSLNPWNALPAYLEQLFAALADTQVPGNGLIGLTFATTIVWNAGETNGAKVTLTGNATLAFPSNLIAGNEYTLLATQDATGNRTLAFAAGYKFASGVTLPLTATASKIHAVRFVFDGTSMLATSVTVY